MRVVVDIVCMVQWSMNFFEFQFADDAALVHDSEEGLRLMVDWFMEMAQAWGKKVSLDKTKIMAINPTTQLTSFVYGPTEHDTIKVVQNLFTLVRTWRCRVQLMKP